MLTLALLLGMLPTTVFAFTPGEDVDVIEFKAMTLDTLEYDTLTYIPSTDTRDFSWCDGIKNWQ